MAKERDWSRYLEIVFWSAAILWLLYPLFVEDDGVPFRVKFYYRTSRICYGIASFAGELGLEAERAYWEIVRELHA